jgi:hypothetical protein
VTLALASRRTALTPPWVRDFLWRRARAVPSLDLRFADNKSLIDAVTGASLVTLTRASSGMVTDSAGALQTAATDVPRFDHDPTTGESLGLLVEEQRTNNYVGSENIAGLSGVASTVASSTVITPSNNTNAISVTEDSTNEQHYVSLTVPITSGTSISVSIFAKQGSGTRNLTIRGLSGGFGSVITATFDLIAGTANLATASIQAFRNGWYRCTFTATATATGTTSLRLHLTSGTVITYQGDNTSSILLYGPQAEAASTPTSYIPTTTAAVTRSADVASITGSAFSSWYRQDEGSLFVESATPAVNLVSCSINDGTNNNRIAIDNGNNTRRLIVTASSVAQANVSTPYTYGSMVRSSIAYKTDDFILYSSGVAGVADTSGALPLTDRLTIGANGAFGVFANGTIRRICYWPQRLANSTLQNITQ